MLGERLVGIQVLGPATAVINKYRPMAPAQVTLAAQLPLPRARSPQWLHSFSSLTRGAAILPTLVHDGADGVEPTPPHNADAVPDDDGRGHTALLALSGLRGPRFGDAVHGLLEQAATGPLWPAQRTLLQVQLGAQGLLASPALPDEAATMQAVAALVDRVRQSPLANGLRLDALAAEQRVVEFEFQFPVGPLTVEKLERLCAKHGFHGLWPAEFQARPLNGMLTGFADLVFHWQGRYHVLDYKSNWLGAQLNDYRPQALQRAMTAHHYPLQALLYTVALHRHLRQRLDGYSPEQHLGDSWYLFVRAVGLAPDLGVWRQSWPVTLIETLDAAFAGDTAKAA